MTESRWTAATATLRRVAFDTNSLIYFFEAAQPRAGLVAHMLSRVESRQAVAVVSTIVEMEIFVKPLRDRDQARLRRLRLFFDSLPNLVLRDVDRVVAHAAARVRAGTHMKAPDALIAATAMAERCDAIIGNDRDFARRSEVPYLVLDDFAV